jgi:hypothetical protein
MCRAETCRYRMVWEMLIIERYLLIEEGPLFSVSRGKYSLWASADTANDSIASMMPHLPLASVDLRYPTGGGLAVSGDSGAHPSEAEPDQNHGEADEDGCFVGLEGPVSVGGLVRQDLVVLAHARLSVRPAAYVVD